MRGNFFQEEFRAIIKKATIIFVNNFIFGTRVDEDLKQLFREIINERVDERLFIISAKPFCKPRNLPRQKRS